MRSDTFARVAVIGAFALSVGCGGPHAAFQAEKDVDGYRVGFEADPLVIGERNYAVVTLTRGGSPVDGALVMLRLSMPKMRMPQSEITLLPQGRGHYAGHMPYTMSGEWLAGLVVQTPENTYLQTEFAFSGRDR